MWRHGRARAVGRHRPAMQFHQSLADGESDSEATAASVQRSFALREQIEDAWQILGFDPAAEILDFDEGLRVLRSGSDADARTRLRVFDCIGQEIAYALRDAVEIDVDQQFHRRTVELDDVPGGTD